MKNHFKFLVFMFLMFSPFAKIFIENFYDTQAAASVIFKNHTLLKNLKVKK